MRKSRYGEVTQPTRVTLPGRGTEKPRGYGLRIPAQHLATILPDPQSNAPDSAFSSPASLSSFPATRKRVSQKEPEADLGQEEEAICFGELTGSGTLDLSHG